MISRRLGLALGLASIIGLAPRAGAQETPAGEGARPPKGAAAGPAKMEVATLGGGCFWCLEAVLERLDGVKSVVSGFSGGTVPNPSYELVCTGSTGHAEVVQVEFDPAVISYSKLLEVFFKSHDPTTLNRQGPDTGTQYRSIILYHSPAQKDAALALIKEYTADHHFASPIVTQVTPFAAFYSADEHHQDYYRNNKYSDYSQIYIAPKIQKVRQWWNTTHKPAAK